MCLFPGLQSGLSDVMCNSSGRCLAVARDDLWFWAGGNEITAGVDVKERMFGWVPTGDRITI